MNKVLTKNEIREIFLESYYLYKHRPEKAWDDLLRYREILEENEMI